MALNRSLVIEKTGEKMLQGWKLLSFHCPICNTALLSKKMEMFCVGCDMNVITEAEYEQDNIFNSPTVDIPTIKLDSPYNIDENGEDSSPLVDQDCDIRIESNVEFQASRKRMDEVSKMLGQKMLNGWALLGEICPSSICSGTPLMSQKEGPMVCVCCSAEYIRGSHGELVASAAKHVRFDPSRDGGGNANIPSNVNISSTLPDNNNSSSLGSNKAKESTVEDISHLISDKLLSGWTLLDDSCLSPNCRGEVPLMRNKRGEKICVKCAVTGLVSTPTPTTITGKHVKLPEENIHASSTRAIGKRDRGVYSAHLSVDRPPPSPPPAPENDLSQLRCGSRGRYAPLASHSQGGLKGSGITVDEDTGGDSENLLPSEPRDRWFPLSGGSGSGSGASHYNTVLPPPLPPPSPADCISTTLQVLQQKMRDVSKELEIASHPTVIRELADTLRSLADTWMSVRRLSE